MFYIFQAPLPPLGKGTPPLSKSMKALPPLQRNSSLDKLKKMDSLGSSFSPLGSPKPKQSSLVKEDKPVKSAINKKREDVTLIDKDDHKAPISIDEHPNGNPSNYYGFLINHRVKNGLKHSY